MSAPAARGPRRARSIASSAGALSAGALLPLALAAAPLHAQPADPSLSEAVEALRSGAYDDALAGFRASIRRDPASVEARRGLVETLLVTGKHAEAEAAAREAPAAAELARPLGRTLLARGDLAGAEAAFRQAIEGRARDALAARVDLAELQLRTGRIEEAMAAFDRFIDVYNDADGGLPAPDLVAVGRALRHLGRTDPDLFHDALRAFDEAAAADPAWPEPRLLAGELLLEKYQSTEAQSELARVLERNPRHPRALLASARALAFDGAPGARERALEALEVDPSLAEARAFLAELYLTREGHEEALEEARTALEANPSSLEALAALAAAHFVAGDTAAFREARRRALAIGPGWSGLDLTVARIAERTRRYAEAVERARAAVALDSTAWTAWGVLGMNELRGGRIAEGRANLERAFAGDPFNPWFKNNLDLLDTFERYETVRTEHFEIFMHGTEAELLAPLAATYAEEAYESLRARYGVEPPLPQRVEMFPSHADFSVRTLGEVGLGALGVSFGPVLVMDSPAARAKGEYNWASVLWHELAHSFHLALTDHRVPRWFSEGLAVHEQRKAREGWGFQPTFAFLRALREGRLKPVSELNDGFMRPDYPQQVVFSYYQASLVFELIESRHGFGVVRDMLDGYRRGATTEELFPRVLGVTLEAFDETFDAWLRERFDGPLAGVASLGADAPPPADPEALLDHVRAHPGDLVSRLRLGALLTREGRYEEARPHLERVLRAFPEYAGPDSPYLHLARIHREEGDLERAAAALARLNGLSESHYDALLEEAELAETLGRPERAAWAVERAVQVYPYEIGLHERAARIHAALGDREGVVRARAAVVALGPADRAEALYLLAVAQRDAGLDEEARRSVLRALELAPNYEAALELLLDLRTGTGTEEGS